MGRARTTGMQRCRLNSGNSANSKTKDRRKKKYSLTSGAKPNVEDAFELLLEPDKDLDELVQEAAPAPLRAAAA